ncbi:MAG: hypothetical protein HY609_01780 [Deltaproteobacteria bacterium]|nr:hypothetical protein [Deltaproteobacteria bacterium]
MGLVDPVPETTASPQAFLQGMQNLQTSSRDSDSPSADVSCDSPSPGVVRCETGGGDGP